MRGLHLLRRSILLRIYMQAIEDSTSIRACARNSFVALTRIEYAFAWRNQPVVRLSAFVACERRQLHSSMSVLVRNLRTAPGCLQRGRSLRGALYLRRRPICDVAAHLRVTPAPIAIAVVTRPVPAMVGIRRESVARSRT